MISSVRSIPTSIFRLLFLVAVAALCISPLPAQQTLGGITGEVSDSSGGVIPNAVVTITGEETGLTRTVKSNGSGEYLFVNLPIGTYTLTFTAEGFEVQSTPHITVQADRTATVSASLKVGSKADTITVDATPLMNAVDTTNGYVLDKTQIESVPLPTGSFTGLATGSPGVNAELPGGTGANSGLGNAPIWANGQRDTSNSFSLNGVDATNLFNGKSNSQEASARVINSTGSTGGGGGGVIASVASVYLTIGNAIPTPAPETLQEVRVNASMYDASQGSTSGAHIDISTGSGTNAFHGTAYAHRGTNWINAAPFFFKQDNDVPVNLKNPELHRYIAGGSVGGPIIKDKLFGFFGYQHLQVSDQEIGDGFLTVPVGLGACTARDAQCLANIDNAQFNGENPAGTAFAATQIDKTALQLFNSPALPGEPCTKNATTGQQDCYLIPDDTTSKTLGPAQGYNAFLPGTGRFKADMGVGDLDFNATAKDTLALKYYYQHDPTLAPYTYSSVPGFTEHLDSGAQVFSITNTYLVKPNLSTTQTLGFLREKDWADNEQPFGPGSFPGGTYGTGSINEFGSSYFPGVSIVNVLGAAGYAAGVPSSETNGILNVGPNAEGQAPNTGVFQNRIAPSANAIWTLGKHNLSFGSNYSYTQLNTIDKRTNAGTIATDDFSAFSQGYVTPGSSATAFYVSSFLQGNASRYYRANQLGAFLQDKVQLTPALSLTAGVRYDWDGGLTEKNGRIFNFDPNPNPESSNCTPSTTDPNQYLYCVGSDTIANPGFIIAGNNANGTKGISNTTLTGRQWGVAPRIGAAWQPAVFHDKVVVRTGAGMYYDRGELFSYFSPGYAIGTVTGGPFGVNQQLPFVNASNCPVSSEILYNGYLPTCGGGGQSNTATAAAEGDLENPYGTAPLAAPSNPKATDLSKFLPNAGGILNGGQPISLGIYDRANKLPYTFNYTLDVQWQPRNDLAIELGYVGNLGRHQVIPVPFNQPNIASPTNPILAGSPTVPAQIYTYGYTVQGPAGCGPPTYAVTCAPIALPSYQGKAQGNYLQNYEGGNVDLRVPYIGYAAESIAYKAAGVDSYNALQAHIDKRMSHSVQVGASYTYSHTTDEQSGLGLFYNGSNALNLRSGYGLADFDRTHVLDFNYVFQLPDFARKHSLEGDLIDGWSMVGLTIFQSGQPYSVIDFSGSIGSIYYSTADGITNPIVPLAKGCTAKSALTGHSGAFYLGTGETALKYSCFTLPQALPGSLGGAIPANDPFETTFTTGQRNIFRQSFQKRADASLVKVTNFRERYNLKYTFDVYNLTNTSSFDVPGNEVSQNAGYNPDPVTGTPVLPGTCSASGTGSVSGSFFSCPSGLGIVTHSIGSPRQIQMSLSLTF